ncbi:serine hydrolase [Emticicia oligotrophica]|uniref:serine hydrolase domain-containing protein n=1 Tax=Emticicia oligotrophica TaxID=312279 RepID=UPI00273BDC40|nr:serine hydrolase domain-containing protein [Emticicia oligotrophica]
MKYKFIILPILLIFCFASCTKKIHSVSNQSFKIDKINDFISHQMDSLKIPAVSFAIINNSKIVYHATFGVKSINTNEAIAANSLFDAGSLTKTVFAYFVLRAVNKNQIDLDAPLYQYLPNKDIEHDERYKKITARMVLSHSSGFPNWRRNNKDGTISYQYLWHYHQSPSEKLCDVWAKGNLSGWYQRKCHVVWGIFRLFYRL